MPPTLYDTNTLATELALALTRLRARLREESHINSTGLSASQLSIFQRLRKDGPATAALLASIEHVSQQAIAQSLVNLKSSGLIKSDPDPSDGRKTLLSITLAGHTLHESMVASRNAWLAKTISSTLDPEELAALDKAITLLERLAASNQYT